MHNDIAPFYNYPCPLCKKDNDTIKHLLFNCNATSKTRQTTIDWLQTLQTPFNFDTVVNMTDLDDKVTIQLISLYKYHLLTQKNFSYNNKTNDDKILEKIDEDLQEFILYNNDDYNFDSDV